MTFVKVLGISLLAGAGLLGLVVILGMTRYSPFLNTYLSSTVVMAVLGGLLGFAVFAAIGGIALLKARSLKKAGVPFIILFVTFAVGAPTALFTIVETQVIKGEIDLARISTLYSTAPEWETRAETIRQGILRGAELTPLPARTPLNATIHSLRVHGNYSVENVYFESFPGFFVTGNLYRPAGPIAAGLHPVILVPHGHHNHNARFEQEIQQIATSFARLGANVFTYDMVGKGESNQTEHERAFTLTLQLWNSMRVLDFMLGLNDSDPSRVGMTGASGGGTQTFLLAAVDSRLNISAPVVMVSSYIYGGCPCENGMPIHRGNGYATNNAEIAALHAPQPMLLVSDGDDWTRFTPVLEFPFIQRIYGFYGLVNNVVNAHFPSEEHDYGVSKRNASMHFFADQFGLDISRIEDASRSINETANVMETMDTMRAFTGAYPRPVYAHQGEESIRSALHALQPGWQPAVYPVIDGGGLVPIVSCVGLAALSVIARSRRKMKYRF
nr:acetylxylan esterase [Candidatus Sigynarchaeota archaeon]